MSQNESSTLPVTDLRSSPTSGSQIVGRGRKRSIGSVNGSDQSAGSSDNADRGTRASANGDSGSSSGSSRIRSRGWCLTVHFSQVVEGAEDGVVAVFDRIGFDDAVAYCCMQFETCPETGRRHCQGYVYFKLSQRFSAMRKYFDTIDGDGFLIRPHIERAKGNPESNIAYCSKDDTAVTGSFREWGTRPVSKQGSR